MGAGVSASTDAEKIKAYDTLAAQYPDLVKKGAIKDEAVLAVQAAVQQDDAAQKLQAIMRGKNTRKTQSSMAGGESLADIFKNFCSIYRQDTMTNTIFAKFCKDGKLLDKKFTKPQIDMVWSKAAGKEKKVGLPVFEKMLASIAEIKGKPYDDLVAFVQSNAQVKNSGTQGESRFYDDKDTWTGAAAKGGVESKVQKDGLATLIDRDNVADVRGAVATV